MLCLVAALLEEVLVEVLPRLEWLGALAAGGATEDAQVGDVPGGLAARGLPAGQILRGLRWAG